MLMAPSYIEMPIQCELLPDGRQNRRREIKRGNGAATFAPGGIFSTLA